MAAPRTAPLPAPDVARMVAAYDRLLALWLEIAEELAVEDAAFAPPHLPEHPASSFRAPAPA